VITPEQSEQLWQKLLERDTDSNKSEFGVANLAYYLGALIVMSAMGWR